MPELAQIKRKVAEVTIQVTGEGELPEEGQLDGRLEEPLDAWGVDSLSALELAVLLERQFGVRIEEQELAGIRTLADIVRLIDRKGNG